MALYKFRITIIIIINIIIIIIIISVGSIVYHRHTLLKSYNIV